MYSQRNRALIDMGISRNPDLFQVTLSFIRSNVQNFWEHENRFVKIQKSSLLEHESLFFSSKFVILVLLSHKNNTS
jgi:hypothetical protein